MSKESEFLDKLKETFKGEAAEHRALIVAGLLELETGGLSPDRDTVIIENVFREIHSLKGAARAVNIRGIERICQSAESIFSNFKKNKLRPPGPLFNVLYRAFDIVENLTYGLVPVLNGDIEVIIKKLENQDYEEAPVPDIPAYTPLLNEKITEPFKKLQLSMPDTVRITSARLNAILLRAEEMLSVKEMMARHMAELRDLTEIQRRCLGSWHEMLQVLNTCKSRSDSKDPQSADPNPMKKCEAAYGALQKRLDKANATANRDLLRAGEQVDSLLVEIKTALLQPFSSLLEPFALMVHDLAMEEGKELSWVVSGEDTSIDRRVLEKIKDPLMHMVRNSISHGIEPPADRKAHGKPRVGRISLEIGRVDNDKVQFLLRDDGAGIDVAAVKAAAVAKGLINEARAQHMTDKDALDLVFLPELSTSPIVTVVSGRGLGLAIAFENIEMVGGQISIETKLHAGTTFIVQLPLSLATFRAVLVKCNGRTLAVPTMNIIRVFRTPLSCVRVMDNRESLAIGDRVVALADLGKILGLAAVPVDGADRAVDATAQKILVMVLLAAGTQVAYRIDEVEGEQELLAKDLGKQLLRVRNISAAAIIPGGAVIPILNPADLLKSVILSDGTDRGVATASCVAADILSVLVADDSITSRSLMKSMLESAGYRVKTAVDGMEAFAFLQEEPFDLLISDVEMPRMNGLTLCEKVRKSKKTSDIPIILVTSKDAPEDRERGMEAGADALISKSSVNKSSLLNAIQRFV